MKSHSVGNCSGINSLLWLISSRYSWSRCLLPFGPPAYGRGSCGLTRHQKGGGAVSVVARRRTPGVKPLLFSEFVVAALAPSCRRALSLLSSCLFSLYLISCRTHRICCRWRSMTSWLWAVAASTLLLVSLELPALTASPLLPFAVSGVSMTGIVEGPTPAWLSAVSLVWPDQSVGAIVSLCSDVAVRPKVLSDQYIKGWVYNGVGCTVVEQSVVARVTMIPIDE